MYHSGYYSLSEFYFYYDTSPAMGLNPWRERLYGHLRESDALDLDVDVLGEGLDGDAAASGLVGEPLLVLAVHLLKLLLVIGRSVRSLEMRILTAK